MAKRLCIAGRQKKRQRRGGKTNIVLLQRPEKGDQETHVACSIAQELFAQGTKVPEVPVPAHQLLDVFLESRRERERRREGRGIIPLCRQGSFFPLRWGKTNLFIDGGYGKEVQDPVEAARGLQPHPGQLEEVLECQHGVVHPLALEAVLMAERRHVRGAVVDHLDVAGALQQRTEGLLHETEQAQSHTWEHTHTHKHKTRREEEGGRGGEEEGTHDTSKQREEEEAKEKRNKRRSKRRKAHAKTSKRRGRRIIVPPIPAAASGEPP